MADKVIKAFRDKRAQRKLRKVGDVYESEDSKRRAFLIEEGFVEAEKASEPKKGKSSKKDGE